MMNQLIISADATAVIILTILTTATARASMLKSLKQRCFLWLAFTAIAATTLDILEVILTNSTSHVTETYCVMWLAGIVEACYGPAVIWYVYSLIREKAYTSKHFPIIMSTFSVLNIFFQTALVVTRNAFYIERNTFFNTKLLDGAFIVDRAIFIVGVLWLFLNIKRVTKEQLFGLIFCGLFPTINVLYSFVLDWDFGNVAATIGIVALYATISIDNSNIWLELTKVLGNDFADIYYINASSNKATVYRISDYITEAMGIKLYDEIPYEQAIKQYVNTFVDDDYKEAILNYANREWIKKKLDEHDIYDQTFISNKSEKQAYIKIRVAKVKNSRGFNFVLGFANVDEFVRHENATRVRIENALKETQEQKALLQKALDEYEKADYARRRDYLTGMFNRQELFDRFNDDHIMRAKISAVYMIDIDNFKSLNDTKGHSFGDECLVKIASALKDYGKEHDIYFYRYGGEEIVGVYVNDVLTPSAMGKKIVDIVYNVNIERDDVEYGRVTVSVGGCAGAKLTDDIQSNINKADAAMYRAKVNGKNQLFMYK